MLPQLSVCDRSKLLPEVLESLVGEYLLGASVLWQLNRDLLGEHYVHVLHSIRRESTYDSHMRDVLRHRRSLIFRTIVDIEHARWRRWRRYSYKGTVFRAYPQYLMAACLEYGSQGCRQYLVQSEKKLLCNEKTHKRERRKGTRWST